MRLVSLWWELPPWLDSNINIWNLELQDFFCEKQETVEMRGGQKTLAPSWDLFLGQMRGQSVLSPLGFDLGVG
jgi:hypothetical protein